MTTDELRALDCRVATEVFGWTECHHAYPSDWWASWQGCPPADEVAQGATGLVPKYTESIAAAMKIVEAWNGTVAIVRQGTGWRVDLGRLVVTEGGWAGRHAYAAALPLAIVQAVLAEEE